MTVSLTYPGIGDGGEVGRGWGLFFLGLSVDVSADVCVIGVLVEIMA